MTSNQGLLSMLIVGCGPHFSDDTHPSCINNGIFLLIEPLLHYFSEVADLREINLDPHRIVEN